MTEDTKKYADRIAKLLAKAESTNSQEEADAFVKKAQELMITYAIDEEMLARAQGKDITDVVVEESFIYGGSYRQATFRIGQYIAQANDCRVLLTKNTRWDNMEKLDKTSDVLHVIGFKSDVDRARLLDTSLQVQAAAALNAWVKAGNLPDWMSGSDKFKARREFLFGFASGLKSKLDEARAAGIKQAETNHAARTKSTQAEASTSVALVLKDKQERVNDWVDEKYGKRLRSVTTRYSRGSVAAATAGHSAGRAANTGAAGLRGRAAIGGR